MLSFAVLGSGSSGNSTVVLLHGERACEKPIAVLIDAGLTPRATNRRLAEFGMSLADVSAILITHFDGDHFVATWGNVVEKLGLMVYCHHRHRRAAAAMLGSVRRVHLFRDSFQLDGLEGEARTALAPHDEHGTASYRLDHRGARFGFATDIGRVTHDVLDLLRDVDGLAIESNYDPDMQRQSGRPTYLKRRIMGGLGHLSNIQSLEAVQELSCQTSLQHIAALHLSRQCNEPGLITAMYAREAKPLLSKLTITSQIHATPMLRVTPGPRSNGNGVHMRPGEQHVLL
jgi:phosphoribosyl 1,2-cyclic phosphodiesterase